MTPSDWPLRIGPLALLLALVLPAQPVGAQGGSAADHRGFGLSLGLIDFTRDLEAFELGAEYRFREYRWGLVPTVGIEATEDESVYGYFGFRWPYRLSQRWLLDPTLAAGLYDEGDGKDLGGPVEFRSGLDLLYELPSGVRIGLGFYHISNCCIYDRNPGTNSLLLRLHLPPR